FPQNNCRSRRSVNKAMSREEIIDRTRAYVQKALAHAEAGHDWWHISRVLNNTRQILASEPEADALVCELAALLHDIADKKFHEGDQDLGPRITRDFLNSLGVDPL